MTAFETAFLRFTEDWRNPVGLAVLVAVLFVGALYWEQSRFILKSLRRNLLRSVLTGLAIFVLVLVVTIVWSILAFLDKETSAKAKNLKAIITNKYESPTTMPFAYAASLSEGAARTKDDYRVNPEKDSMAWAFYIGTLDPTKLTRENMLFFFALDPRKLLSVDARGNYCTMMEDVDQATEEQKRELLAACQEMERNPYKVLAGPGKLKAMNKKVGERIKVIGRTMYTEIDLECEILGELPGARYDQNLVMNYQYLDEAIRAYNKGKTKTQQHQMTEKVLAVMFLRLPDTATFEKVAHQITSSPEYQSPPVKCETLSSGISSFLDGFRDLLFGMRWLLVPAILITMALVIANAISISVRERRIEMAVLKVLGFTPNQILIMVLAEALLIGCLSGLFSGWIAMFLINDLIGGVSLPIGFLSTFFVAQAAPWWGLSIGALTALAGSLLPAWSARSVKVSEVFSKIA